MLKAYIPKKINNISFFSLLKSDIESYISKKEYKEIIDALTATQALDHKEFLKQINEYQPI
jgi:hypothetical protein